MTQKASPSAAEGMSSRPAPINQDLLGNIGVMLEARIGKTSITIKELAALKTGSVVTLQSSIADEADLYLDGTLVARGEIVAVGDNFGVRITEVADEA